MKNIVNTSAGLLLLLSLSAFKPKPESFDLRKVAKHKGFYVFNRELTIINEDGYKGIRLSKDYGEGVAWLKGMEFSNGTIEFDVRGEDVMQHSFVGIAFHGKDNETFDAIYLRPFRFKSAEEEIRSHSIQYIALPNFTWRVLREKFPNKYEHAIDPSPDPNSWVRLRIVVEGTTVSTYVNGAKEPSLVFEKVSKNTSGNIGFYVADTSGGDFANLTITKN